MVGSRVYNERKQQQHFIKFYNKKYPIDTVLEIVSAVTHGRQECLAQLGEWHFTSCELLNTRTLPMADRRTDRQTRTEKPEETSRNSRDSQVSVSYHYRCNLSARIRQCASTKTRNTKNKYEQNICLSLSC